MKTESLHDRYLDELKDLYSDAQPLLDTADSHETEAHRNQSENILVFAAALDKMD